MQTNGGDGPASVSCWNDNSKGVDAMQVRQILDVKGTVLYTIAPDKKLAEAVAVMSAIRPKATKAPPGFPPKRW